MHPTFEDAGVLGRLSNTPSPAELGMERVSVTTDLFWLLRTMNRTSAGARGPPEAAAPNLTARWAVPSSRHARRRRAGARPWMRPSESEQERGRCSEPEQERGHGCVLDDVERGEQEQV
jgi:hypothetical protein